MSVKEFSYRGTDRHGNPVSGQVEAKDITEAKELLWAKRYDLAQLKPLGRGLNYEIKMPWNQGVKPETLSMFARLLISLMEDGRTITQALDTISRQMERTSPEFAKVVGQVYLDMQRNATPFHVAIAKHPKTFPSLMVHLCSAGDRGSFFLDALRESSKAFDSNTKLRRNTVSGLIYPAIIGVVMAVVLTLLLILVVPKMEGLFNDLGGDLPFITKIVVGASEFAQATWWLWAIALGAGIWWWRKIRHLPATRNFVDPLKLRIPKVGPFVQDIAMARFCRNFALLLKASVPVQNAIEMTKEIVDNVLVSEALDGMKVAVSNGTGLAKPLEESWVFPPYVVDQVAIGSESSNLPELLMRAADYYDDEVDAKASRLPTVLNSFMVSTASIMAGFILFAMYMPMFSVYSLIE